MLLPRSALLLEILRYIFFFMKMLGFIGVGFHLADLPTPMGLE